MGKESREAMYDLLAARGVSRRDFLKFCGSVAAMLGMAETAAPAIASAVEKGSELAPVVWLAQGLCTGCTESMAQVDSPDVPTIVLDLLSINYWETVSAAAGESAEKAKNDTVAKGGHIVIVEGAMMEAFEGQACRIAGKTGVEHLVEASKGAAATLAIGSCAVDGGWCKGEPGGATGVKAIYDKEGIDVPVVNLPGCPVNPEWVIAVVVDHLLLGKLPELDGQARPKLIYGATIHDNCPRRGHFENGEFVEQIGNAEQEAKQWCLYKVGCKGPQTMSTCPSVRWNRRASWCVEAGSPCIGCVNMDWVGKDAPFLSRMTDVDLPGIGGVKPETIGLGVGVAAAAGLAVHGVAQVTTGRFGHGAPVEDKKVKDAKKGGDE